MGVSRGTDNNLNRHFQLRYSGYISIIARWKIHKRQPNDGLNLWIFIPKGNAEYDQ